MFILLPVILYYCDIINYTYQMLNYAKKLSFLKSSSDLIFAHFNQNKSEDIISYRFSFKECFFLLEMLIQILNCNKYYVVKINKIFTYQTKKKKASCHHRFLHQDSTNPDSQHDLTTFLSKFHQCYFHHHHQLHPGSQG